MRLSVVTIIGLGLFGLGGAIGAYFYLFSWFATPWLRSFSPDSPSSPTPTEGLVFLFYIMIVIAWVYGGFELIIVGAVLTIVGLLHDLVRSRDQAEAERHPAKTLVDLHVKIMSHEEGIVYLLKPTV